MGKIKRSGIRSLAAARGKSTGHRRSFAHISIDAVRHGLEYSKIKRHALDDADAEVLRDALAVKYDWS